MTTTGHGAWCTDLLAHRADQESAKAAEAARAHDEQVGIRRLGAQDVGRLAFPEDRA